MNNFTFLVNKLLTDCMIVCLSYNFTIVSFINDKYMGILAQIKLSEPARFFGMINPL